MAYLLVKVISPERGEPGQSFANLSVAWNWVGGGGVRDSSGQ